MQTDIHPAYNAVKVTCSCGNSFETRSTATKDLSIDVCDKCHPFYTGQQRLVDTEGRVSSFRKKFARFSNVSAKTDGAVAKKEDKKGE